MAEIITTLSKIHWLPKLPKQAEILTFSLRNGTGIVPEAVIQALVPFLNQEFYDSKYNDRDKMEEKEVIHRFNQLINALPKDLPKDLEMRKQIYKRIKENIYIYDRSWTGYDTQLARLHDYLIKDVVPMSQQMDIKAAETDAKVAAIDAGDDTDSDTDKNDRSKPARKHRKRKTRPKARARSKKPRRKGGR
jgi:hypothetical protein